MALVGDRLISRADDGIRIFDLSGALERFIELPPGMEGSLDAQTAYRD